MQEALSIGLFVGIGTGVVFGVINAVEGEMSRAVGPFNVSLLQNLGAGALSAIVVIVGHVLLGQATKNERKRRVARRFVESQMPILRMNCEQVISGDNAPLDEFELLAGPVPTTG